jgi:hypothetical protein
LDSRFVLFTANAVHYQPTRNGAIVLADGVQFERLYTIRYDRLPNPKEESEDGTEAAVD